MDNDNIYDTIEQWIDSNKDCDSSSASEEKSNCFTTNSLSHFEVFDNFQESFDILDKSYLDGTMNCDLAKDHVYSSDGEESIFCSDVYSSNSNIEHSASSLLLSSTSEESNDSLSSTQSCLGENSVFLNNRCCESFGGSRDIIEQDDVIDQMEHCYNAAAFEREVVLLSRRLSKKRAIRSLTQLQKAFKKRYAALRHHGILKQSIIRIFLERWLLYLYDQEKECSVCQLKIILRRQIKKVKINKLSIWRQNTRRLRAHEFFENLILTHYCVNMRRSFRIWRLRNNLCKGIVRLILRSWRISTTKIVASELIYSCIMKKSLMAILSKFKSWRIRTCQINHNLATRIQRYFRGFFIRSSINSLARINFAYNDGDIEDIFTEEVDFGFFTNKNEFLENGDDISIDLTAANLMKGQYNRISLPTSDFHSVQTPQSAKKVFQKYQSSSCTRKEDLSEYKSEEDDGNSYGWSRKVTKVRITN